MKRIINLLLLIVMCSLHSVAQHRSVSKAKSIAQKFFTSEDAEARNMTTQTPLKLTLVPSSSVLDKMRHKHVQTRASAKQEAPFYIFNDEANGRFVIVSGDERQYETLGSSDNGVFNPEEIPCGLFTFLEQYNEEYDYLQENDVTSTVDEASEARMWKAYKNTYPLIQTKWGQSPIYNDDCPMVSGKRCLSGCVATAMAQVMNYHRYPERGEGTVKRVPGSNRLSVESLNLSLKAFDWSSLSGREKITSSSPYSSKTAVAYLMKACGYAVNMDYGLDGSGALPVNIPSALIHNFSYGSTTRLLYKDQNRASWESLIQNELQNNRPIIYIGYGSGGHCFILDGYQSSTGKYAFNWGWSGQCDGYYYLSSLRPGGYNFTERQQMVVGIYPSYEEKEEVAQPVIHLDSDFDRMTITCATDGVTYYYSFTPQDDATTASYQRYYTSEKIPIIYNGMFRAYVEKKGKKVYAIPTSAAWFKVDQPEFYPDGNKLTIKCPSATTIRYTKDGTTPTKNSLLYTGPITCTNGMTIKAIGVKSNYTNSNTATYEYKEEVKTVLNITNTAGKISEQINNESKQQAISLTVSGELNGTDIKFIHEMCEKGQLSRIDMKNASIVSGGVSYFGSNNNTTVNVIGKSMFYGLANLSSIELPSNIVEIGDYAFLGCTSLKQINIPATCKKIGTWAFRETAITSLYIPQNVEEIKWGLVQGCKSLIDISVDKNNKMFDSRDNCNAIINTAENILMAGSIRAVIPTTVTRIDMHAFCSSPSKLTIPGNVEVVSVSAFEDNTSLEEVTIEEGTEFLYSGAFNMCTGLKTVSLPSTLWMVFDNSFKDCTSLRSFTTHRETPVEIKEEVFAGSSYKTATLYVPYGTKEKYQNAPVWKDFGTIVEMEPDVHSIAELNALADDTYAVFHLKDVQVALTNTSGTLDYIYIQDDTGGYELFGTDMISEFGVKAGDYISGTLYVMKSSISYSALVRGSKYYDNKLSIVKHEEAVPIMYDIDDLTDKDLNKLISLHNVELEGGDDYLFAQLSSGFLWCSPIWGLEPEEYEQILAPVKGKDLTGKRYNLTGIYQSYGLSLTRPVEESSYEEPDYTTIYEDGEVFTAVNEDGLEITYKILSANDRTCQVGKGNENAIDLFYTGEVTIPSSVRYKKGLYAMNFKVVGIAGLALFGLNYSSVYLPNSIETIEYSAFGFSRNITSIEIPSGVKSIGENAFWGCSGLKEIRSYITDPPAIDTYFYEGIKEESIYTSATLYVPEGTLEKYKTTEGWKNFQNIVEFPTTGIYATQRHQESNGAIYTVSGQRLKEARKGINIIGNKKVIIK